MRLPQFIEVLGWADDPLDWQIANQFYQETLDSEEDEE